MVSAEQLAMKNTEIYKQRIGQSGVKIKYY